MIGVTVGSDPVATEPPSRDHPTKERTLDAAAGLLAREGASALTVRRIAAAAETSTIALYHWFGGKDGVLDALYRRGFRMLSEVLVAARSDVDPRADLEEMALAYLQFSQDYPTYYEIMFNRPVPGWRPTSAAVTEAMACFSLFVDALQRCVDGGMTAVLDVTDTAKLLWCAGHGITSLRMARNVVVGGYDEQLYRRALGLIITTFLTDAAEVRS